jgi:hypothetical protein
MRQQIWYINIKHPHFCNKVQGGTISIPPAITTDMLADILTKVCHEEIHTRMRELVMGGWKQTTPSFVEQVRE